jgi:hypothetical protein
MYINTLISGQKSYEYPRKFLPKEDELEKTTQREQKPTSEKARTLS